MPTSAFSEVSPYEDMLRLHEQMLAAAKALAWDQVIELEARSARIVASFRATTSSPAAPQDKALMSQILSLQEQIRDEVSAWRQDVAPLLHALSDHGAGS